MRRVKTVPQNKLSSFDFESGDEVLLDKIRNVTTEKFRCDRGHMGYPFGYAPAVYLRFMGH